MSGEDTAQRRVHRGIGKKGTGLKKLSKRVNMSAEKEKALAQRILNGAVTVAGA